jgi:hypothetical protein
MVAQGGEVVPSYEGKSMSVNAEGGDSRVASILYCFDFFIASIGVASILIGLV